MKSIILFSFFIIFTKLVCSGTLKMESAGYFQNKFYTLVPEKSYFAVVSNKNIVSFDIGVYGSSECNGVIDSINGVSSYNLLCKLTEKNGDISYSQFKKTVEIGNRVITFTTLEGSTGRWKELIGYKCIGASSIIDEKKLEDNNYEGKFIWSGKCDVPDEVLERVKNFKKPQ